MTRSFLRIISFFVTGVVISTFLPLSAFAATVNFTTDAPLVLSGLSLTLTILANSTAGSLSVGTASFNVGTDPGNSFSVKVPSGYTLINSIGRAESCNADGTRTLTIASASDPFNATVTPTATENPCAQVVTGNSGNAVASGGGGGSSSSSTPAPASHGVQAETGPVSNPILRAAAPVSELALAPTETVRQEATVKGESAQIVIHRGSKASGGKENVSVSISAPVALTKEEQAVFKPKKGEEIVRAVKAVVSSDSVTFSKKVEVLLPLKNKTEKVIVYSAQEDGKGLQQKLASKVVSKVVEGKKQYFASVSVKKIDDGQTFLIAKKKGK